MVLFLLSEAVVASPCSCSRHAADQAIDRLFPLTGRVQSSVLISSNSPPLPLFRMVLMVSFRSL